MILQALVGYYEAQLDLGTISKPGWGIAKVTAAVELGDDGALLDVYSLMTEQQRGKKVVLAPQLLEVPAPVKRTVGVESNFLCDHAGYLFGIDTKGDKVRSKKCFEACKELHLTRLEELECAAAKAVCHFFKQWYPENAREHPVLMEHWDKISEGGNLVFY